MCYQLAQYFVADEPPPPLVKRMAHRYVATDGHIREVLATMFASDEFWDRRNYGIKFKTPYEYVISAVRAAGVPLVNVLPLAGTMAQLGMPLYGCQTPDGYKNTRAAWLNPDAMMTRLSFATALGSGRLPLERPPDGDFGAIAGLRNPVRYGRLASTATWMRPTRRCSRRRWATSFPRALRTPSNPRRRSCAHRSLSAARSSCSDESGGTTANAYLIQFLSKVLADGSSRFIAAQIDIAGSAKQWLIQLMS